MTQQLEKVRRPCHKDKKFNPPYYLLLRPHKKFWIRPSDYMFYMLITFGSKSHKVLNIASVFEKKLRLAV